MADIDLQVDYELEMDLAHQRQSMNNIQMSCDNHMTILSNNLL